MDKVIYIRGSIYIYIYMVVVIVLVVFYATLQLMVSQNFPKVDRLPLKSWFLFLRRLMLVRIRQVSCGQLIN